MSIVPKETVEVIAQSIGINNLSPDAALALAPDVEYRMREIIQEGIKCMHHSKRTTLTTDDVDSALGMRNVEPIYGFASGDPLKFKRALGHNDLFYIDDKDVDFKDVIEAPLPKAPLDTSFFCHWLAIEGVQPAIPENAPVEGLILQNLYSMELRTVYVELLYKIKSKFMFYIWVHCGRADIWRLYGSSAVIAALPETKKSEQKSEELPVDIRLPVKHVLSRELQLYFNKVTELAVSMPDTVLFKEALASLATDSGLHPLVPYFTCFIEDEVSRGLNDFQLLFALMRLVCSLLQNPHIHVEPYLHQLMPPVVTCIVTKRLGNRIADNHWELRDFTAKLAATICKRFGHNYSSLQTRLTKTLLKSFLDRKRTLTQHYGAVQGLAALGPHVVRLLLLPNVESYLGFLEEVFQNQKKEITRYEAWRVYGALLRAAGRSVYDLLKLFPVFPSPPPSSFWRTNTKVIGTSETHKRKADTEELEQQPSPKKTVTERPAVSPSNNASITSGETGANAGEPEPETLSAQMQTGDDDVKEHNKTLSAEMQTGDDGVKDSSKTLSAEMQTGDDGVKDDTKTLSAEMQTGDDGVKDDSKTLSAEMQTDDDGVKDETRTLSAEMQTGDDGVKDDSKTLSAEMQTDDDGVKDDTRTLSAEMQTGDDGVKDNSKTLSAEMQMGDDGVKDDNKTISAQMQTGNDGVKDNNRTISAQMETGDDGVKDTNKTLSVQMQTGDDDVKDNNTQGRKDSSFGLRTPAYLKQVWKDDLNSGQVVMSLFEVFGEGIMSFIPAPEMSLFL